MAHFSRFSQPNIQSQGDRNTVAVVKNLFWIFFIVTKSFDHPFRSPVSADVHCTIQIIMYSIRKGSV